MTLEAIYRQIKGTWRQYMIRHDKVNESRIESLIDELEPEHRTMREIQQKAYQRRYGSERDRTKKMEEAKTNPSETWNYSDMTQKLYINIDKRKNKYFVQYINEEDKTQDSKTYCDSLEEARDKFEKKLDEITKWIY